MLELREVCKRFPLGGGLLRRGGEVRALDGIDLSVAPGETVALVGESGSGKTTAANLALGLEPPSSGEVRWRGRSLGAMTRTERRAFRPRPPGSMRTNSPAASASASPSPARWRCARR